MAVEADRAERRSGRLDFAGYCCFVDYDTRGGMRKGSIVWMRTMTPDTRVG